LAQRSYGG